MTSDSTPVARVVALGASNLTRGFHTIVSTARHLWGPEVEVLGALGHGRSYGAPSRVIVRTLPGILQSELWPALVALPPASTRALVTDVGNDILYGYTAAQTLAWVEEAVERLLALTDDVVVTDLPVASVRGLSPATFLFFRSLFFPGSRLSLAEAIEAVEQVSDGLARLAASRHVSLVRLRPEWYGFDPIHIRPSWWRRAWEEILCGAVRTNHGPPSRLEAARLYFMPPQRRWLFGIEQVAPQTGVRLPGGGRVWLY